MAMATSSMRFPSVATPDENVIAYELFFTATSSNASSDSNDDDDAAQRQCFTRACDEMLAVAQVFTRDFIWQCQQFHLALAELSAESARAAGVQRFFLRGETRVGDEIQDEWVITALLVALTKQFPDVVVRVRDSDGEFLLIECADALPEWVHPENSADRVLLCSGALHLVPPAVVPEATDAATAARRRRQRPHKTGSRTSKDALASTTAQLCMRAVLAQSEATRASDAMQRALERRLEDVPSFMQTNRHRVQCLLPARAAHVLKQHPALVGAAVEAFYYREPSATTAVCARMAVFAPTEALVTRSIAFSRCMFAQLKQQQFFAPKPFERSPQYHRTLAASASDSSRHDASDAVAHLAADIGMKLACGLELLYAADGVDQFGASYQQLMDAAFATSSAEGNDSDEPLPMNDDDAWLYVHPDSLEAKLQDVEAAMGRASAPMASAAGDMDSGGAEELESIATMFTSFLGGVSGLDGVESTEPIQFDMSAFMNILNGASGGGDAPRAPKDSNADDYFYEDDDDEDSDDSNDEDDEGEYDDADAQMEAAMAEMDAELAATHMGKSFARVQDSDAGIASTTDGTAQEPVDDAAVTADTPLDLDFNLLSNLLESFASQDGHAGPVSNILSELQFPRTR